MPLAQSRAPRASSLTLSTSALPLCCRLFAVSTSLPVELQRVVHTIKDIDERQSALRDETRKRAEQCLAMPSASSRQASADDVDATNAARKEIERNHADIIQLSL